MNSLTDVIHLKKEMEIQLGQIRVEEGVVEIDLTNEPDIQKEITKPMPEANEKNWCIKRNPCLSSQ